MMHCNCVDLTGPVRASTCTLFMCVTRKYNYIINLTIGLSGIVALTALTLVTL